ncbi:hypothetical protein WA026_014562 [Henosepilachna vigintioctopunctata]|uniref:Uncharacterized protein n=1 Tax=Henosepilachna vigintioctopunctata TaxID=420089 RepID=A0AAW1VG96_9CUCU
MQFRGEFFRFYVESSEFWGDVAESRSYRRSFQHWQKIKWSIINSFALNTCHTIPGNPTHQRTKSSPESLLNLSPAADSSARLINSESMNDISWDRPEGPPGTPPPPYPSPRLERRSTLDDSDGSFLTESGMNGSFSAENTPGRGRLIVDSSPIHAATPQVVQ